MIKNWYNNFISLFFPSISAYRSHDKDIIEYIEDNTLIEMNCKRILNLAVLLILLPASGLINTFDRKPAFFLILALSIIITIFTIIICVKIKAATKLPGNGFLLNKHYFERTYITYWTTWVIIMLAIGFTKLNCGMNGSYLFLTQLCLAFFPLIPTKKFKSIGIFTAGFAILLVANLLYYGKDEMFFAASIFIVTNMIIVFILSYVFQRLNCSICVMIAYVQMVGFLDQLTGVFNRRGFQFRLDALATETTEAGVIMLDIDFFKKYNDTFGHMKGDEILKQIADTLKDTLDYNCQFITRFGGEEFLVLCLGASLDETLEIANGLKEAIGKLAIPSAETSVSEYLTVSMGVSHEFISNENSLEEIANNADKALYRAKENGRNQIVAL